MPNFQTILVVVVVSAVCLYALYRAGVQRGKDKLTAKLQEKRVEDIKKVEIIHDAVADLDDIDLLAAADEWVRPAPKKGSGK